MRREKNINPMRHLRTLTAITAAAAFHICAQTTQPAQYLHQPIIPEAWEYTPDSHMTLPANDGWWTVFGDPMLSTLIEKAETGNFNVASALKRMEIAEKGIALSRSGYFPQLDVNAGWTAGQSAGAANRPLTPSASYRHWNLGLSANWEIDLFGRIASQLKAGKAGYRASKADYDAVMVSLAASVAKTYMQLRTAQAQYAVAQQHLHSQKEILRIVEARFKAGIGDMLEVTQAKTVLYSTEATVPALEASIRTAANSIAVLTGQYPAQGAPPLLETAEMPVCPPLPATGVPADLLRRRPDIIASEATLAQYAAMIGVAKKDFLPTLAISGSISTQARDITDLFGSHSLAYEVAPTLSWTLFDGMARNIRVAEARLQMEEAVESYNMTVMNAIEEVDNAIISFNASVREAELNEQAAEQSRKSLELSVDLYKRGLTDFYNVTNAQMSYLENQSSAVAARGNALAAVVALYEALGGSPE